MKDKNLSSSEQLSAKYYFIVASSQFLLVDEPLEEILRERVQHYRRTNKPIDFWLIQSPEFLESTEMLKLKNELPKKCSAIISTEQTFITWLKLRLNNVAIGNFVGPTNNIPKPLASIN